MLDDEVANALLGHMHHWIARAADEAVASIRGSGEHTLSYPADVDVSPEERSALAKLRLSPAAVSGLRKIIADACSKPCFHFLCVVDGVGDPEDWKGDTWLGIDLEVPDDEADREMLHDRFFETAPLANPPDPVRSDASTGVLVLQYRKAALSGDPWPAMASICLELQRRGETQGLLTYLTDPDLTVREWAALMALHFAPAEAERTLEELSRSERIGARMILADWRAGRIRPLAMGKAEWIERLSELRRRQDPPS